MNHVITYILFSHIVYYYTVYGKTGLNMIIINVK